MFPEYTLYHTDRSEAFIKDLPVIFKAADMDRGGVAMLIKQTNLQRPIIFKTTHLEVVGAFVNNVLVVTFYRSPTYHMELFMDNLIQLLTEIQNLSQLSIITGDFNINVLHCNENKLVKCLEGYGYTQIVNIPTTEGGTCLDLIFVRGLANMSIINILPTYYSYHDAVEVSMYAEDI